MLLITSVKIQNKNERLSKHGQQETGNKDMIGNVRKTYLECIAVAFKFLDGKIFELCLKFFFKPYLNKIS